jgi:hypothetical protein
MRVLDVVDGVLLAALLGEIDVDVDRLVVSAGDEVPARGVDPDLLDELAEKHHVAAPLRRLLRRAALDDVDELVDQDLQPIGLVAEHRGRSFQAADVPVVVGAEDVHQPVEAPLELVADICDVPGEVEVAPVRGTDERPVLVVAVLARPGPRRSLGLVAVD